MPSAVDAHFYNQLCSLYVLNCYSVIGSLLLQHAGPPLSSISIPAISSHKAHPPAATAHLQPAQAALTN
eukprot:scaffold319123_cov15-Tisochrysis_lutea.AAC.1